MQDFKEFDTRKKAKDLAEFITPPILRQFINQKVKGDNLNILDIVSGCQFNQPDVEPFGETVIGPWPAYGTVLGDDCQGYNKRNKIADGFGGYYWKVIKLNSEDCGYIEPIAGDTGLGGANINIG